MGYNQRRLNSVLTQTQPVTTQSDRGLTHTALGVAAVGALWFVLCKQLSREWSVNEQYNYGWFVRFYKEEPFNFGAESARLLLSQSLEIRDFISEKAMELDNQARQATSSAGAEFISPEESASRPARLGEI